jgi:diguanylate cyclase (GGDEF)-like protein
MRQIHFINACFAAVIILLIVVTYISYLQLGKFLTANNWVVHTLKVMDTTDNLLAAVLDAESITRGYLVTNEPKYIKNFDDNIDVIWSYFRTLKKCIQDNKNELERVATLEPILNERLNSMQNMIEFKHSQQKLSEIGNLVNRGQDLNQEIRSVLNDIYQSELKLLQDREAELIDNFNMSLFLIVFVSAIGIITLISILLYINYLLGYLNAFNKELEQRTKDLVKINEMNALLVGSDTLKETLHILSSYSRLLLPNFAGAIYLMKASANYLELITEWGDPKPGMRIFAPDQCWALKQGKIHEYSKNIDGIACVHTANSGAQTYICAPLLSQSEIIGVLFLELNQSVHDAKEIKNIIQKNKLLIQNLCSQIALAISNIRMHEVLKTRSTRDPLTHLYNRTFMSDTLERDLQRAKRKSASIAVIMMDIDTFKTVNDTFGHDAGDIILKRISNLLNDSVRGSDIICRYGGDEFLVILYDTSVEDAFKRIEHLRARIAGLQFEFNNVSYSPTASFGIAMFPTDSENGENLIKAADEALYQSKHRGRNCTTILGEKPSESN